jgi:nitrite reductase/ring-hydroxylating ferredoxin subunit
VPGSVGRSRNRVSGTDASRRPCRLTGTKMAKLIVGPVDSLPPGTARRVEVGGRSIAVFNAGGDFFALRDVCPHQGACLSKGLVVEAVTSERPGHYAFDPSRRLVRCPWHGWEYELATGRSWFDPAHNRVRAYPVSVQSGASVLAAPAGERVPGPYAVETFAIAVENDYVVVEL